MARQSTPAARVRYRPCVARRVHQRRLLMRMTNKILAALSVVGVLLAAAPREAAAQSQPTNGSPWVVDVGIGIDPTLNGNINSGAIGTLQGQATAILPNSYG